MMWQQVVLENRIPNTSPFNVIRELDVDVHQALRIQRLSQTTPIHIDNQMRYARPRWHKMTDAGADKPQN